MEAGEDAGGHPEAVHADRKKAFKKLVGVDKEEATSRRREQSVQIRKASRDKAISAKRFKHEGGGQAAEGVAWTEGQLAQVVAQLQAPQPALRDAALQQLRRLLSSPDPPLDLLFQLGAVPLLIRFLTEPSAPNQLSAAWCLTNVATGSHEQTLETLKAAPFLINFLTSGDPAMQEQAAWAIANMAGDSVECRDMLRAQGALPPMIHLLHSKHPTVVQTAAFALCNLVRGQHPRLHEAFDAGILEPLLHALTHPANEVVIEALWLLSYITAYGEPFLRALMENQLAPRLMELLARAVPETVLPLLRVFGNLISRSNAYTDALLSYPPFLPFLIHCIGSETRPVRKEATWVISNLSGGTPEHVQAILQSGLGDLIVKTFKTQPFDIKKEAGFALMNIASEKRHLISLVEGGVLPEFISLLKAPDLEVVVMGLDFLAMVLDHHPDGALLVEEEDGLETLENLQYNQNEVIASKATQLVRKYYGDEGES